MALHIWHLVIPACIAVGAAALTGRYGLHVWAQHQLNRLTRESAGLSRCWSIIGDLPATALTEPVRNALGALMQACLQRARRIQPDHPFLLNQQHRIERFVEEAPARAGRPSRAARQRAICALRELEQLLADPGSDRVVPKPDLVASRAAVSHQITEIEFLSDQGAVLQADYLRRVTRALDASQGLWVGQLPGPSKALPTQ